MSGAGNQLLEGIELRQRSFAPTRLLVMIWHFYVHHSVKAVGLLHAVQKRLVIDLG